MKISFLVVGKTSKGWIREALDVYLGRLAHYANFEMKELPALNLPASINRAELKNREGEMILKSVQENDRVILLDERGDEYTSGEWAKNLQKMMSSGKNIVFVAGGAFGFSDAVYKRADGMMCLGRMTYTHQMIRIMFTEQLYRAFTIINGEPYHNE